MKTLQELLDAGIDAEVAAKVAEAMALDALADAAAFKAKDDEIAHDNDLILALNATLSAAEGLIATRDASLASLQAAFDAYKASHPDAAPPVVVPPVVVPPVVVPPPVPATGRRGWELNETNTGLAGVDRSSLTLYTGPDKLPAGTVLTLKKITNAEVILSNGNITLDRCLIQPTQASGRASIIFGYNPDVAGNQLGPVTIMDCDIDASLVTDTHNFANCAFRGAGTLLRNRIWGMGSGIAFFGSSKVPVALIEGNYVYGLRSGLVSGGGQSHNESGTIRSFGGTSLIWRDNRLVSKSGSDSGALFIQAWAGAIKNVLVEGNAFETFGYCMPLEANSGGYSNMKAKNNRFVPGGYGVGYVTGGAGWSEWTDNYMLDATKPDFKGAVASKPS